MSQEPSGGERAAAPGAAADDERERTGEGEGERAGGGDRENDDAGSRTDGADPDAAGTPAERDPADGPETEREHDPADAGTGTGTGADADADAGTDAADPQPGVPEDVRKYDRFQKMDGAQYDRVNDFLRERTYVTAREWAIARLCSDFRTETGVEMTKIGENLPDLVPFMTDTYTPQAVNQARSSFDEKVRKAGATFLYGAMCDFYTADELDELMYEVSEVAKFLLEVEGVDLSVEEELEAEERISTVMREVREASAELRAEDLGADGDGDGDGSESAGERAE